MAKHKDDLRDIEFVLHDVIRFCQMEPREYFAHIKDHPEDNLHQISVPGDRIWLICNKSTRCFQEITDRHIAIQPDRENISWSSLNNAIRAEFVKTFIYKKQSIDRKNVDRMLSAAVREVKKCHSAITHFLPCVATAHERPESFEIGQIHFRTASSFFSENEVSIEADSKTSRVEKLEENAAAEVARVKNHNRLLVDGMYDFYKSFLWIAEVNVPVCDPEVSANRAETAVQATLDLLKVFFGPKKGADLRLGHNRGRVRKTAKLTRKDGKFRVSLGRHSEGALISEDWYQKILEYRQQQLYLASDAIRCYLEPERMTEHVDRWLGALNWYGQAVSERLPSAQLVKYVAALERLTITGDLPDITDIVTRRTAVLGAETDDAKAISKVRDAARTIYRWRSDLMHGRISPGKEGLQSVLHLAHHIVPIVVENSLLILSHLDNIGKNKSCDLEDYYRALEHRFLQNGDETPEA